MRPTLVLVILIALLALGGALFFFMGNPESAPTVEGAPGSPKASQERAADTALDTPEARAEADELAKAERTSIAAPPTASATPAKPTSLAALFGRVIDTAGQPVSGAEVRARLGDFDLPEFDAGGPRRKEPLAATSDAQGRFEITGVKPGSVRLTVRAAGFVPLSKPGVGVPQAPRHDLGDLALETSVILEGRVVDSRGAGVEGARLLRTGSDGVMLLDANDDPTQGPPPLATTSADGSFRIDQLATGPWRLRIATEAHPDKIENGQTKRPGERVSGLAFVLEDGFEIAGRVTGVPSASVSDASVVAMPPASGQAELILVGMDEGPMGENRRRAKLSSDGSFVVKGLRPGAYQLQARVKGTQDMFWPRSASERVEAKSGDRGVLIAWQPASVLSFQVVDAQTKAPIEQLEISATTRNAMAFFDPDRRTPRRYENGMVVVDDLRPRDANDRATLDISSPGYRNLHMADLALERGKATDLGVLELERSATIEVHVVDSATRADIAKAKVSLSVVEESASSGNSFRMARRVERDSDNGEMSFGVEGTSSARTDEKGMARINSTPGKRGKLSVNIDGYAPYSGEPFDMPEGANVEQLVALDQGGSVEITLLSSDGLPVSGARIDHRAPNMGRDPFADFAGPGAGKGAATDSAGKVSFANLAPGKHRFRPAKGGGPDLEEGIVFAIDGMDGGDKGWSDIEVVRGTSVSVELREPERAEVKGHVREAGSVLAGASISLRKTGGDSRFEGMEDMPFGGGGPRAKSDGEGRYRFEKVDPGSYELVVRHATRAMPMRFPIEVEVSGLEYDIDLPISILEGRVSDGENQPVAGAKVWAERKTVGDNRRRMVSIVAGGDEGGMVFDSSAGLDQSRA
ncbi:MAG TPA: carboxypeptidase regulatory-like domain-containing protein, partial [Planctomycetota bacterium]|nr:carboxypeptidase regulatory-like domain-containing protein [Planctomycetota bacterium]